MRTTGMRTIGMRTIIGMEDNWHAEIWHGGQLALTLFYCFLFNLITLMF